MEDRNHPIERSQPDAGLVKAGNVHLRTAVIEAAHRLSRYDLRWKEYSRSLRARGKCGSVVAAAVANRWTRGLVHAMHEALAA